MSVNRKAISEHAQKSMIFDTSAFISLESINILELVLSVFSIITTNSAIKELEEFAKHGDKYGRIAKNVLKHKSKFTIESCEITESIEYVEAHGTGTQLGDPIEIFALKSAYDNYTNKKNYCQIKLELLCQNYRNPSYKFFY